MALIVTAILISTAMNMAMPQISTKTLFDDVLSKVGSTPAQQLLVTLGYRRSRRHEASWTAYDRVVPVPYGQYNAASHI